MDVHFIFEHHICHWKHNSISALSSKINKRLLWHYRRFGSNNTFLLIMRHFICAQNLRSVKRDVAQRKKSASSIIHAANSHHDLICRPNNSHIYNAQIYWRTEQFAPYTWTKELKDTNPLMSSLLVICLGCCSNFVGSESSQKQSVILLQNMVYRTIQHPPSHTHCPVYTVRTLGCSDFDFFSHFEV